MISAQLQAVRARIAAAAHRAGRNPEEVRLICVSKTAGLDDIRAAIAAGATDLGESRIQEARPKILDLGPGVARWHMIGHLQSNKAKAAAELFDSVQSVDSEDLARTLDRHAGLLGKCLTILIEVNVSGEASKQGIAPEQLGHVIDAARALPNLELRGLMAMAPLAENSEASRPHFRKLKELAKEFDLAELSMGMSQDFEVAVEEGATMVRVGSAIFENKGSIV